jgi:hypothetical protein
MAKWRPKISANWPDAGTKVVKVSVYAATIQLKLPESWSVGEKSVGGTGVEQAWVGITKVRGYEGYGRRNDSYINSGQEVWEDESKQQQPLLGWWLLICRCLVLVRVELGTWTVVHVHVHVHVHVRVHCGNGIGSSGPLLIAEVFVEKISHVRQGKQDGSGDKTRRAWMEHG